MILPKVRDPRLITIRRGGWLTDAEHHLLALWAATCAEHVLSHFEHAVPDDPRPRQATERDHARRLECAWQRAQLPPPVRDLVIEDQQRRNDLCWNVFDS